MALIVAARFQTFADAESAAESLYAQGFLGEDISTFYVNTAGQHGLYVMGGDRAADPDSQGAQWGAIVGAACVGLLFAIVGSVVAWRISDSATAIVAGAGLGAYLGSLWGALWVTGRRPRQRAGVPSVDAPPEVREAGVVLALHIAPEREALAVSLLRQAGGRDVERAQGRWLHGKWEDFDPLKPPEREPETMAVPPIRTAD